MADVSGAPRAVRFAAVLALLLPAACGGEPFIWIDVHVAFDIDGGTQDGPFVDGGRSPDTIASEASRAPDASEGPDAEASADGGHDAPPPDVVVHDAPTPGPLCCNGQAAIACGPTPWSCYPVGANCAESCQAFSDGGQFCTTTCPGAPTSCTGCAPGLSCLYTDSRGQTLPGTVAPCD